VVRPLDAGRRSDPAPLRARRLGVREIDLALSAIRSIHGSCASRARIEAFLADPTKHLYVTLAGNRPVALAYGFELPWVKDDGVGFILYELDTHPDFRRRGAARALLAAMEIACRGRGIPKAWLVSNESNVAAMALYRAVGAVRPNRDDAMWVFRFDDRDDCGDA